MGYYVGRKRYIMITDLDFINNVFIKNVKLFYNREDFALDAKYLIDSVLGEFKCRGLNSKLMESETVHTVDSSLKSLECNAPI